MPDLYHSVHIGNLITEGNIFLAPLAGYTDKIFRKICLDMGASLAYTEMVSTEGIARGNKKTTVLMDRTEGEENLCIQIFMNNLDSLQRALPTVLSCHPSLIDINAGCPVPKVVKNGAGSALMNTPDKLAQMIAYIKDQTDIPVTVKIRTGWDKTHENYLEVAEKAVKAGVNAITMHARTKSMYYKPSADWSKIADLKVHFSQIPVFGSGDLLTPEDGKNMLQQTGADGIMFARGAIGNPFIFKQTATLLKGEKMTEPSYINRAHVLTEHLHLLAEDNGQEWACRQMRKFIGGYLKGIPGSATIKKSLMSATTFKEYESLLIDL